MNNITLDFDHVTWRGDRQDIGFVRWFFDFNLGTREKIAEGIVFVRWNTKENRKGIVFYCFLTNTLGKRGPTTGNPLENLFPEMFFDFIAVKPKVVGVFNRIIRCYGNLPYQENYYNVFTNACAFSLISYDWRRINWQRVIKMIRQNLIKTRFPF